MLHSSMGSLPPSSGTRSTQVSTPVSKGPIANGMDTQVQRSLASVKKESSPTKLLDHLASPSPDNTGASQEKASTEGMTVEDNALSSFDFLNEEDSDDDDEEEGEEEGGDEWVSSPHNKQVCVCVCV